MDNPLKKVLTQTTPLEMTGPPVISTGNYFLDNKILVVGGLVRGKMTEFFGKEQSGKSTIAAHCIANAQKAGLKCAYIDTEGFLDGDHGRHYGEKIGIDFAALDYWYTIGPAEKVFFGVSAAMKEGLYGLVVIDSLPYLRTDSQLKGLLEGPDASMGGIGVHARVVDTWVPVLHYSAHIGNTALLITNQIRANIQTDGGSYFSRPLGVLKRAARGEDRTTGGKSLRHVVDVRLYIQRIDALVEDKETVGAICEAMVVKSRVSPPFTRTGKDCPNIPIYFDGRIIGDEVEALFAAALTKGIIRQAAVGWYTITGVEGKLRGKQAAIDWINEHLEFVREQVAIDLQDNLVNYVEGEDE